MDKSHKEKITAVIRSISGLPDEEIQNFVSMAKIVEIAKGDYFLRQGEVPQSFAFVLTGLFRYSYLSESGKEFTKGFFPENAFISSYSARIQNRGSYYSIEALEDSTAIVIDYRAWMELAEDKLCWYRFLLALLEKGYCAKEEREREFLLFDAKARYQAFLSRYPGLEQRIRQHHIASYLGITPVALSRIRKEMGL